MAEFSPRSDSVNVEQIMEQIRGRIREKRGVDYTEQQVQELAKAKLEELLDPRSARSDVLDRLKKLQPSYEPPQLPAYEFEDSTLFDSHRGLLRFVRRLLNPILKLFFNPNPLIGALNTQARLNAMYAEREARRDATRQAGDQLQYELLNNLLIEITRTGIEIKNLKMRIESIGSRLEFNERRARSLESAMAYRSSGDGGTDRSGRSASQPTATPQQMPQAAAAPAAGFAGQSAPSQPGDGTGQRSRRRRRRRGRRGGAGSPPGAAPTPSSGPPATTSTAPAGGSAPSTADSGSLATAIKEDLQTFSGAAAHPAEADTRNPEPVEPSPSPPPPRAAPDVDDAQ